MSNYLFKKNVDQSLLKDGMTIPKEAHKPILNNLSNPISRGENCPIVITVDGTDFEAKLTWVNFSPNVSTRDVLQIRYTQNSAICQKLRSVFARSLSAITNGEEVPDTNKESIEIFDVNISPKISLSKDLLLFQCP